MPESEITYFAGLSIVGLLIGGFAALLLAPIYALFTGTLMLGVLSILVAILIIYVGKYTEVDALTVSELVVLFLMIGGIGTIITGFVPQAAAFILSGVQFTVSGLGFTLLYILIADAIVDKVL